MLYINNWQRNWKYLTIHIRLITNWLRCNMLLTKISFLIQHPKVVQTKPFTWYKVWQAVESSANGFILEAVIIIKNNPLFTTKKEKWSCTFFSAVDNNFSEHFSNKAFKMGSLNAGVGENL